MKLLLDTHIFIWWADQPEKLSLDALSALEDEANELLEVGGSNPLAPTIQIKFGRRNVG